MRKIQCYNRQREHGVDGLRSRKDQKTEKDHEEAVEQDGVDGRPGAMEPFGERKRWTFALILSFFLFG